MTLIRIGLAVGDRVIVRSDVTCAFCDEHRIGARGRTGQLVDVHDITEVGSPAECPPDHTYAVLYDEPWSDGQPGFVRRQYFAQGELRLI